MFFFICNTTFDLCIYETVLSAPTQLRTLHIVVAGPDGLFDPVVFSGMIPGHLPRRIPKMPQKSPLCIFFNSRWPPPCNAILKKQGYTLILHLCS